MDVLRMDSVRWTQWLQQTFETHSTGSEFLRFVTQIYETSFVIWWLYPLASYFEPFLGFQVLLALIISQFSAIVFKLVLPDDRPYWWFPKTEYSDLGAIHNTIVEYPETCEITSGFPSSSAAAFAAISYLIITHIRNEVKAKFKRFPAPAASGSRFQNWISLDSLLFLAFLLLNAVGIISRIFVVTSFHYQLIMGALLGYFVGKFANTKHARPLYVKPQFIMYGILGLVVLLFSIAVFTPLHPMWTIEPALEWCWNTERFLTMSKEKNILSRTFRLVGLSGGLIFTKNVAKNYWKNEQKRTTEESGVANILLGIFYMCEILLMQGLYSQFANYNTVFHSLCILPLISCLHVITISIFIPNLTKKKA